LFKILYKIVKIKTKNIRMPVTDLSLDQLSKQHPELASVIYQKAEREIQSNYQRQLELLKRKNNNLESEIELLRSKGRFDRDQFVIEIKKENILLIREYEGRIADKITEINLLKKELARERLRVSDKSGELVLK
jgi:cell division protein FtsB